MMQFFTQHSSKLIRILILVLSLFTATVNAADTQFIQRHDVQEFINNMVKKHHFNKEYLIKLFGAVKIRPQVIQHVKKPLEKEAWYTYRMLFITDWRVKEGVLFWKKYEKVLKRAEEAYGIPASIIVATIGIETKYGQRKGDYRVMDALTNLAFSSSPRAPFFRKELEQFLLLSKEEHLDPLKIMGSYAGAIGQPQFMPSSYRHYAVNFSKSGKTDLMNNEEDVIGSVANYYNKMGWKINQPVAIQAIIIGDRYRYLMKNQKIKQSMSVAEAIKLGVVPKKEITPENQSVKVVELQNRYNKEYWLGFHNFNVIKRYNASDLYAMAVYQLSNYISASRERSRNG